MSSIANNVFNSSYSDVQAALSSGSLSAKFKSLNVTGIEADKDVITDSSGNFIGGENPTPVDITDLNNKTTNIKLPETVSGFTEIDGIIKQNGTNYNLQNPTIANNEFNINLLGTRTTLSSDGGLLTIDSGNNNQTEIARELTLNQSLEIQDYQTIAPSTATSGKLYKKPTEDRIRWITNTKDVVLVEPSDLLDKVSKTDTNDQGIVSNFEIAAGKQLKTDTITSHNNFLTVDKALNITSSDNTITLSADGSNTFQSNKDYSETIIGNKTITASNITETVNSKNINSTGGVNIKSKVIVANTGSSVNYLIDCKTARNEVTSNGDLEEDVLGDKIFSSTNLTENILSNKVQNIAANKVTTIGANHLLNSNASTETHTVSKTINTPIFDVNSNFNVNNTGINVNLPVVSNQIAFDDNHLITKKGVSGRFCGRTAVDSDPSSANGSPDYNIGDIWTRTSTQQSWVCVDNTAGSAVWEKFGWDQSLNTTNNVKFNQVETQKIINVDDTGTVSIGGDSVKIGNLAGVSAIGSDSISIGKNSGSSQQSSSIAIGVDAGKTQNSTCVAIGYQTATNNQGISSVAIGAQAGLNNQSSYSVAIGQGSGLDSQGQYSVALGTGAGSTSQLSNAVAIGRQAGELNQNASCVAIGFKAGNSSQTNNSIAIGSRAGETNQTGLNIAIGSLAGFNTQGNNAIAIGASAGVNNQGAHSIAIGTAAGVTSQSANSIILNASGSLLDAQLSSGFFVKPIASQFTNPNMRYNVGTGEITYNSSRAMIIGDESVDNQARSLGAGFLYKRPGDPALYWLADVAASEVDLTHQALYTRMTAAEARITALEQLIRDNAGTTEVRAPVDFTTF